MKMWRPEIQRALTTLCIYRVVVAKVSFQAKVNSLCLTQKFFMAWGGDGECVCVCVCVEESETENKYSFTLCSSLAFRDEQSMLLAFQNLLLACHQYRCFRGK